MKNMINLIKLHYTSVLVLKKSTIIAVALSIFIIIINKNVSMLPFGAAIVLMLLNYSTLAYEDNSKFNYMIYSLPIKPKEFVLSKYIYGVINVFVCILLVNLIYIGLKLFNMIDSEIVSLGILNLSIMSIGFFIVSIVFPIAFVVGFNKARVIIVLLGLLLLGFSNILTILPNVFNLIVNMSIERLELIFIIVSIILTTISYFICSNLYSKKDIE
ncbi:MAG: ABC-2 transporter permease [Clostridium butyricum]|nr:ABC-2 transporter permease [Clostridium butyricum]